MTRTKLSPAALAVLVCVSVLLAPTIAQVYEGWCNPEYSDCSQRPEGPRLNLAGAPIEPVIKPCSFDAPCPHSGLNSWWHCTEGTAGNGCKVTGPFKSSICSSQCTFSPATAVPGVLHAYKVDYMYAKANEPEKTTNPFFYVPAGRVEKICVESCEVSRFFNEFGSLLSFYRSPSTLQLFEIVKEGKSEGRGRELPVQQEGFTVAKEEIPAICFKSFVWGSEEASKQLDICERGSRSYWASGCSRTCYDNTNNALDLVPGDRVAVGLTARGQYGDSLSMMNLVISVYSESSSGTAHV